MIVATFAVVILAMRIDVSSPRAAIADFERVMTELGAKRIKQQEISDIVRCSPIIGIERKVRVAIALGISVTMLIEGHQVVREDWSERLGKRITGAIKRRKLSYSAAAALIPGADKSTIYDLLNGRCGLEMQVRAAIGLGVRLNLMIDGQPATATTGAGSRRKKVAVISRQAAALPLAA